MAREVFDTRMVAHVWAQQNQAHGRNNGGNFYFRDSTIYSYGGHFPIARFVTNKRKERAVLFTTRGYSRTTSKHISAVRQALQGLNLRVFHVYDPSKTMFFASDAKEDFGRRIDQQLVFAARARKNAEGFMVVAISLANEANELAKFFGQRWRLTVPVMSPEFIAEVRAEVKASNAKEAKAAAEREAKVAADRAECTAKWLAGEVDYLGQYQQDTLLRVKGDEVQTSRGAKVPVDHARRVWPHILRHQQEGRVFEDTNHAIKVGNFGINRIEANGDIKAGCHFIKFDQIHKIAQQLGLAQGA